MDYNDELTAEELDEELESIRAQLVEDGLEGDVLERAMADWCRHLA
jgi:hypothetical protein